MKDEKDLKNLLDKLENVDECCKDDNEERVLHNLTTRILSDIDNDDYLCDCYFNRMPIVERAVLVLLKKALKEKEDKKI